jgi:predicted adenine nucleotide alpha hydrolase (AANH) superfamily ATPase
VTVKISARAIAQFIVGGPTKKQTIVRNVRQPQSVAAKAMSHYYSPAVNVIRIYHERNNDKKYMTQQIKLLEKEYRSAKNPWALAKFKHNLRCINEYLDRFGDYSMVIMPRPRIAYLRDNVRVSASPDLAIESNGEVILVRLGTSKKKENAQIIEIILRITFEAAKKRFEKIAPKNVLYLDLTSSGHQLGASEDPDLMKTIDRACAQVAQLCAA